MANRLLSDEQSWELDTECWKLEKSSRLQRGAALIYASLHPCQGCLISVFQFEKELPVGQSRLLRLLCITLLEYKVQPKNYGTQEAWDKACPPQLHHWVSRLHALYIVY